MWKYARNTNNLKNHTTGCQCYKSPPCARSIVTPPPPPLRHEVKEEDWYAHSARERSITSQIFQ